MARPTRFVVSSSLGMLLLGGLGILVWRSRPAPPPAAKDATVPVGADFTVCADCHSYITDEFHKSPHFDTLHRPDEPLILSRFEGAVLESAADGPQLSYRFEDGELILLADDEPFPVPTTFVFGSGRHGQTPVSTRVNVLNQTELLEHDATWYPGHGLGLTVGHREEEFEGLRRFGHPRGPDVTADCFNCHTSHLPRDGELLNLDQLILGIRCNKCHLGLEEHVAAAEQGTSHTSVWSQLSPRESIRRCGECHRTIENIHPQRRRPDETSLTRFAPVGLELSPCFQRQQARRLDCLTCHDPHGEPPEDLSVYRLACLDCHDGTAHPVCSTQSQESDCLGCHMPKVDFSPYVQFTDHWIRIRDDQPEPDERADPGVAE